MKTKNWRMLLALVCLSGVALRAQDVVPLPMDRGSAAVWQDLRKLSTVASALHVTAHPDDEDGGMLNFESRAQGVRMGLLTLTRGEGGQNIMSADYFDALGLLRTRELLDADRYYGVEQMFTRAIDYGFSKTAAEARQKWGEQRVLGDAVRAIRTFRPLVVIARFQGSDRDGHGNHQMSGIIAREAFYAAADPSQFPEQIRAGLRAWRARKLYMDNVHEDETWNLVIHSGDYNPVLGDTYADIGRKGWWNHRSQNGGGFFAKPGKNDSYYKRLFPNGAGGDHEQTYFDGIDVSLPGLAAWTSGPSQSRLRAELQAIAAQVARAAQSLDMAHPDAASDVLARGLAQTREVIRQLETTGATDADREVARELHIKEQQFQTALADALGIDVIAVVRPEEEPTGFFARFFWNDTFRVAIPGQTFGVEVDTSSGTGTAEAQRSGAPIEAQPGEARMKVSVDDVALMGEDGTWNIERNSGEKQSVGGDAVSAWKFTVRVPEDATFTRPYWRPRQSVEESWYQLDRPQYELRPFAPYPLHAVVRLTVNGVPVEIRRDVLTTQHETGPGQVLAPLLVGPAISIMMSPRAGVAPLSGEGFELDTLVHSNVKGAAKGDVHLQLPPGWQSQPPVASFDLAKDGDEVTLRFHVVPRDVQSRPYQITAIADYNGHSYREGYRMVGYTGIRKYPLYEPATYRTSGVEVKVAPGIRLGYVMGTGDSVPQALENLGVTPHFLTPADIESGNLSEYDEIMLGVRVYAARDDVRKYNGRLLDYVRNGGVLVVQYNTREFDHNYGPYPYKMGSAQEVSEEDAPVQILAPDAPVFRYPNRITEADFNNWVEQRGSRFFDEWAPQYQPLLSSHDQNQEPQRGGFLIAPYGKGLYVLQSYALYRQVPEGVPGAFRLLANLVSLPKAAPRR